MSPLEFAARLIVFCTAATGSVVSWGRTTHHNAVVGGVPGSAHRFWCGADVVYDVTPPLDEAQRAARQLGLALLREGDHDHLQPATWSPG